MKAAPWPEQRAQRPLIESDEDDADLVHWEAVRPFTLESRTASSALHVRRSPSGARN